MKLAQFLRNADAVEYLKRLQQNEISLVYEAFHHCERLVSSIFCFRVISQVRGVARFQKYLW